MDIAQELAYTDIVLSLFLAFYLNRYDLGKPFWKRAFFAYGYLFLILRFGQLGIDMIRGNDRF